MGTTTQGILTIGDITQSACTPTAKLQVWASDSANLIATFKHPNDSQGIGENKKKWVKIQSAPVS